MEAYLSPGQKIRVTITEKAPYNEDARYTAVDPDALDIVVTFRGTGYHLQHTGAGEYSDTAGVIPVMADSSYSLQFLFNGNTIQSETIIPASPSGVTQSVTSIKMSQFDPENPGTGTHPSPVVIAFTNDDDSYYMTTVECMDSLLVPVFKDSIPNNDIFSSMPVTGTEIDIEPMRIRYFGLNRIILYHVNPEYVKFFRHQASTSQYYEQPPTNISNGLGIFTGVNADTLYLQVIQVK